MFLHPGVIGWIFYIVTSLKGLSNIKRKLRVTVFHPILKIPFRGWYFSFYTFHLIGIFSNHHPGAVPFRLFLWDVYTPVLITPAAFIAKKAGSGHHFTDCKNTANLMEFYQIMVINCFDFGEIFAADAFHPPNSDI